MAGATIRLSENNYITVDLPCYRISLDGAMYIKIIDLTLVQVVGCTEDLAILNCIYNEDITQWFEYNYLHSSEKEFDQGVSAALGQCIRLAAQMSNP